ALPLAACGDDFLQETPADFVGPENFYQTPGDAIAAVNAAYATFVTPGGGVGSSDYMGRNLWMLLEYPTEVVTSRLSATNERSLVDNYHTQFTTTHPYLLGVWRAAYQGINRANSVIERVPGIEMDAARRDQIVAEAKFLRALHYYYLAGLFGGVPLVLEETKAISTEGVPRNTAAETWTQIQKDLTEAAAALPASWPASDWGRATKGAALTLLAKAQMQSISQTGQTANWTQAVATLAQVRGLGYTLDPNYASLFDGSNERSREIIFSIQNIRVDGYGGRFTEWFSPITNPPLYSGGAQNQFQAERAFYDSYNATDVRKAATWLTTFTVGGRTETWAWISSPNPTGSSRYGSTGPAVRKYLDLASADGGAEEPDVVVLRYGDVLLMSAEAINEVSGPTAEAYGYVNQVRTRAGVPNLTPGLSKDAFRDSVYLERRYELALEGHGLLDNRRNWTWSKGRLEASMTDITNRNRSPFTSSTTKFDARPLPDKWKLYPIPASACEVNRSLVQNPGWDDVICQKSGS
ncbi:MAG TPA: RagB/SusD family nutrient uptake outer membrane protein, partial [Gemmatimonadaceae bacterium]|nr:RagB/SusD family nutrient uptake outer membrane protein [Gemmatimonadaceae bacterium]